MVRACDFELGNEVILGTSEESTGICMALSCFWTRECLGAHGVPAANPFANWRDYLSVASIFASTLEAYDRDGGDSNIVSHQTLGQQSRKWHNMYFQQLGLHLRELNWGSGEALEGLLSIAEGAPGGAYLLTFYGTKIKSSGRLKTKGGHTVALWYDGLRKAFFDPNDGQFSGPRNDFGWVGEVASHIDNNYDDITDQVMLYSVA